MIRFWSGFDINAAAKADREWDNAVASLVTGAYGVGKAAIPSSNINKTLAANYAEGYVAFHYITGTSLGNSVIFSWQDGSNNQCDLRHDTAGQLFFTRNGTTIGSTSSPGTFTPSTTYDLVARVKIDPSAGIAELKIHGSFVLNSGVTNLNTRNTSNSYFNFIRLIGGNGGAFDHFVLWDATSGSGNDLTGYPTGIVIVDTQVATSAGNNAQWTPLSSTNVSNIDDALQAADDDTTYNSSATANQIDDFTVGNAGPNTGTILGIGMCNIDRIDDATPRTVSHHLESSSATFDGTAYSPSGTYKCNKILVTLDPNTSAAWTVSGRNAAKYGYKLQS